MKYEDSGYPLYYLKQALSKLDRYGMETFQLYCDEVNMSFCDRNRVIAKCNLVNGTKHRETSRPDDLKNERFRIYTKVFKYPEDWTLNHLKRLDAAQKHA